MHLLCSPSTTRALVPIVVVLLALRLMPTLLADMVIPLQDQFHGSVLNGWSMALAASSQSLSVPFIFLCSRHQTNMNLEQIESLWTWILDFQFRSPKDQRLRPFEIMSCSSKICSTCLSSYLNALLITAAQPTLSVIAARFATCASSFKKSVNTPHRPLVVSQLCNESSSQRTFTQAVLTLAVSNSFSSSYDPPPRSPNHTQRYPPYLSHLNYHCHYYIQLTLYSYPTIHEDVWWESYWRWC